ncbi:YrrS family protein [Halalkalibacter alkalisediminis]|uniref:YrrS family protein n=1 Tax=Halalkalibacter alkalisediminis TaxID=935616 RepID=A0ABV6NNN3_9BACI|nr:YrrS family protein [Halalkalibacter alkalisediminis]
MQGFRYEQRKKKRLNRVLNVAISIVTILILFFAYQIFFGSPSTEEVTTNEIVEEEEQELTESSEETQETSAEMESEENKPEINEESTEDEVIEEEDLEMVPEGEWEPVGTEQTEFTPNFSSGSTNRLEMEKAIRYATGLDHNMTVWRIENGGSPTRVRGVVSGPDHPGQPYEVYIEWVDGQGWKPVEKRQLTTNPYR